MNFVRKAWFVTLIAFRILSVVIGVALHGGQLTQLVYPGLGEGSLPAALIAILT